MRKSFRSMKTETRCVFSSLHPVMLRAAVVSAGKPLTWEKICEYSGLTEAEFFAALPEALKVGRLRLGG